MKLRYPEMQRGPLLQRRRSPDRDAAADCLFHVGGQFVQAMGGRGVRADLGEYLVIRGAHELRIAPRYDITAGKRLHREFSTSSLN
jgi:hypothetical protein